MFKINTQTNQIEKLKPASFTQLGFKERKHLQEWLKQNPEALGEELLIIQKEFDGFSDTRERLDLLALDKQGNLVIIENKLDDSGRDAICQALKYASYCSSLTKQQIMEIFTGYMQGKGLNEDPEEKISGFLETDFNEARLNQFQRIILVAGKFRKEVTSTVLWLMNNYNLKIQCFKVTPYQDKDQYFLNIEQIIPVKEIEEYTIKMSEKNKEDRKTLDNQTQSQKLRLEFWHKLLPEINAKTNLFANISPSKDNWISAGAGISGVSYLFSVSGKYASTALYIATDDREKNKFIFDKLYEQKDDIEKITGKLEWVRLDDKKHSRIQIERRDLSINNKENWDEMIRFLTDNMLKFEQAFKKPLNRIKTQLKQNTN